jgi:hypothetical protein
MSLRWTLAGVALAAAHALALPTLLRAFARPELIVDVASPSAAPRASIDGRVPGALVPRLTVDDDGAPGPGLHHRRWTVRYRGGTTRSVGAVQLVGPFQDPARPGCSARVVVGQRFLDDGHASPGTVAHTVVAALTAEMHDFHHWTVGSFRRVDNVSVEWARLSARPFDFFLMSGARTTSYVRATATLVFDRVSVPLVVVMVPDLDGGKLHFITHVVAHLDFDNRVFDWLSDKLDGDQLATKLAREQVSDGLVDALGPPPPLDLGAGRTLRFDYCGRPPEVTDKQFAALPLAVAIAGPTGPDRVLPPHLGDAPPVAPPADGSVTLDLGVDALDAILYELWRTGFLDEELARAGLDRRFNGDPDVQALLSVRLSPLKLPLPPTVRARPDGSIRLEAEAVTNIGDGARVTLGRIWGGLDFSFTNQSPKIGVDVALGALELSCTADGAPRALAPCYADLVGALRDRAGDLHGVLTETFARILTELFVGRRLGTDGVPAEIEIRGVRVTAFPSARGDGNAIVRLALDARVAE